MYHSQWKHFHFEVCSCSWTKKSVLSLLFYSLILIIIVLCFNSYKSEYLFTVMCQVPYQVSSASLTWFHLIIVTSFPRLLVHQLSEHCSVLGTVHTVVSQVSADSAPRELRALGECCTTVRQSEKNQAVVCALKLSKRGRLWSLCFSHLAFSPAHSMNSFSVSWVPELLWCQFNQE